MITSISRVASVMLSILFFALTAFVSEIREFDVKTLQRLGSDLNRDCTDHHAP